MLLNLGGRAFLTPPF